MELLYYVRKCKSKTNDERSKTLHAADNNMTFCGEELTELWFIEDPNLLGPGDITCRKCRDNIQPSEVVKR